MEKYINLALENGADQVNIIKTSSVVTAPWPFYKCKYGCSSFGESRCCPPHSPTFKETRELLDSFNYALLFHSYDLKAVTPLAVKLAKELFLDNFYKAIAFGSGPCKRCNPCNIQKCNFPHETVPAMEACGIDVFKTARNNGFEISTLRDYYQTPDYFGLVLVE